MNKNSSISHKISYFSSFLLTIIISFSYIYSDFFLTLSFSTRLLLVLILILSISGLYKEIRHTKRYNYSVLSDMDNEWKTKYLKTLETLNTYEDIMEYNIIELKTNKNIYELSIMLNKSVLKILTSSEFPTINQFEKRDVNDILKIKNISFYYYDNHLEDILKNNSSDFIIEPEELSLLISLYSNPNSYTLSYNGNLKIDIKYFILSSNEKIEEEDFLNSFIVGLPYIKKTDEDIREYDGISGYYTIQSLLVLRRKGTLTITEKV